MIGNKSVVAIIVTHNRKELLKRCLRGLRSQTLLPAKILVIDNASADGTIEVLEEEKYLADGLIESYRLDVNVGGSGGFAVGIRLVLNSHNPDWIWLMDDDVAPAENCLETLLAEVPGPCIIHPTRFTPSGVRLRWHHTFDPVTQKKVFSNIEIACENYKVETNVACFEGALISAKVLKDIPFELGDFFIHEDDTLYGFLVSRAYPVLYVSDAKLFRFLEVPKVVADWKMFYLVRNQFWVHKILCARGFLSAAESLLSLILCCARAVRMIAPIFLKNLVGLHRRERLFSAVRGFISGLVLMPQGSGRPYSSVDSVPIDKS